MNFQERKKKIIEAVYESGSLSVFELSDQLAMSPATVRRDLHDICEEGQLVRTHGGAMRPENPMFTSFVEKSGSNNQKKDLIAKAAAELVADGESIFLDCGSTVYRMCPYLKKRNDLRIITNSLPILAALIDVPGISINIIGGELDKPRKAIHGEKAIQHINSYHAKKAFIGVDGISAGNGLTAHTEKESAITSAFIRNADQVMLLCDSSKIGKDSYIKFAGLDEISCLVTDDETSSESKESLKKHGLSKIITAKK
ncbi:DeoR/GlpR family DNA-binding transcription regulator [Dyadobacter luticola]|uniref:DeoR/GlpR transcriptional regulator n=1 Tax=Dyadobacter luticola TaxID=1979387 RepID=A0A5R9L4D5_9BACT|nr:DeoR/GlpR family DNA-binding transcription regulator [Dyadobacter luticola]TLV03278.1 DeoR/GlpR transcriptional regulator [Dyadobacter luticola]